MKYLFVLIAIVLVIIAIGCGRETITVPVTAPITVPVTVPATIPVPVTRIVTASPLPTPPAVATPEGIGEAIAANYLGSQEQGGVTIQIVRFLCSSARYFKILHRFTDEDFEWNFGDAQTTCEFILEISNVADDLRSVSPTTGTVIIGDEQIELFLSTLSISGMDDVSGDIYPNVRKVGGFWFGVQRTAWNEITHITYLISAPYNGEYNRQGKEFRFEIDATGWGFEPMPDL